MAVRRDKNTGEPIEELTRKLDFGKQMRKIRGTEDKTDVRREEYRRTGGIDKADDIGRDSRRSEDAFSPFEAPTLKVGVEQEQKTDTDQTRVFQARNEKVEGTVRDSIADPIVGWLVVIAGPGKGKACSLGYGSNSLGRGDNSRVLLDFGDDLISREGHATVTYDSRGRKFFLQHGGGKNLTYFDDEPVLTPIVLETAMEFSIGCTTLRFIPLCGPEFDWEDIEVD